MANRSVTLPSDESKDLYLLTDTYLQSVSLLLSSSCVTPNCSAASATRSWSCARVDMTVNTLARMPGIDGKFANVSVGWQWASKTPRCHGKASSRFESDMVPFYEVCVECAMQGSFADVKSRDELNDPRPTSFLGTSYPRRWTHRSATCNGANASISCLCNRFGTLRSGCSHVKEAYKKHLLQDYEWLGIREYKLSTCSYSYTVIVTLKTNTKKKPKEKSSRLCLVPSFCPKERPHNSSACCLSEP